MSYLILTTRLASPKLLTCLALMTSLLLSCSKAKDDVALNYDQFLGNYSGVEVVKFVDNRPDYTELLDAIVTKSANANELTLTISGERDFRQLVMNENGTFFVKRFTTVVGTSTQEMSAEGSGEFSGIVLTYREKGYSPPNSVNHGWIETDTFTKK